MRPLDGVRVANLGINLPPLVAAARLAELGARVIKVEPPDGDPMQAIASQLYADGIVGQDVVRLDLKSPEGQRKLRELLCPMDLLITSSRPSALERLGLGRNLLVEHQQLVHVAIVGYPAPLQEVSGHDITYVAKLGLLVPPAMPRSLVADIGGAERVVTAGLAALIARDGPGCERYLEVALADAAQVLALPWRHGLTAPDGILGGASPFYGTYEAADGWLAVGALEPHFQDRLLRQLGVEKADVRTFSTAFRLRTVSEWEQIALDEDLPIVRILDR